MRDFFLDHVYNPLGLDDLLYRLFVLFHFAQDGSLVEVGLDDFVFFSPFLVLEKVFFYLDSVGDRPDGQRKLLFLFVDAG